MVWKKGTAPVPLIVYHKTPLTSIPVKGVLIATCLIICYIIVNAGNSRRKGAVSTTQAADPFPAPKRRARHLLLKSCPLPGCFISGKGVRTMSFSDVAVLLTLIGGTIFVTFQITWTIATSDKKRKKK